MTTPNVDALIEKLDNRTMYMVGASAFGLLVYGVMMKVLQSHVVATPEVTEGQGGTPGLTWAEDVAKHRNVDYGTYTENGQTVHHKKGGYGFGGS